ncbi:DUF4845 domain-containing protein [Motiliproteus sp. SC1-56]|uniref:DUF4845 domain-containing protein n=1 Tax=Motiliproteus sp. SC1-56 TaxID=2799565 RepID=UPI001A8CB8FE|nr:DUF4845 domain-containing protein [Motiliproteus sp. SC1-56]
MNLKQRQRGWTFYGVLTFLLVGGVFLTVGFKLAPAYADWHTLKSVMRSVTQDQALLAKSKGEIRRGIAKHLGINNMDLPKEFVTITKDKGDVFLDVNYEIRTHVFKNVDAVMTFQERFAGKELD